MYLHTAFFFVVFIHLCFYDQKGRKDAAARAQAGRAFKREALRRRWQPDPDIIVTQATLAKIFDELDA